MQSAVRFLLAVCFGLVAVQAPATPNAEPVREWTFFFYSGGDEGSKEINGPFARTSVQVIKDIESIAALDTVRDRVAMLLQFDASGDDLKEKTGNREWRRRLQHVPYANSSARFIDSPGIPEAEIRKYDPTFRYHEQDTGNPVTFKKFLQWGIRAYPAKNYAVVLLGHSWGQQGLLQDAHVDGKDLTEYSLLRNYEIRRVMEEVYREDASLKGPDKKIAKGRFDLLMVDACTTGQLDVLLEFKDLFTYFVGSSMETPFQGVPYTTVLDGFLRDLDRGQSIVDSLIKPAVTQFVESHLPNGFLAQQEGQVDPVAVFAVRFDKLQAVADALQKLVASLPAEARGWFKRREPESVWTLSDTEDNADLLQLVRNLRSELQKKASLTGAMEWTAAIRAADELENTLGYKAKNPAIEPTPIAHATAQGAWVSLEIDSWAPNRDVAFCLAMRSFVQLNGDRTELYPTGLKDLEGKGHEFLNLQCNERERELKKKNLLELPPAEFDRPVPMEKFLRIPLKWPQGVRAFVREVPDRGHKTRLERRTLYLWVPKPKDQPLKTELRLKLTLNPEIEIEYLAQSPEPYLLQATGFESWLLKREKHAVTSAVYVTEPAELEVSPGVPGPYLAEAHTNGTAFKQGFGILLAQYLPVATYNYGRLPLEEVERIFKRPAFSMRLEEYERDFAKIKTEVEKTGVKIIQTGEAYYRMNRIEKTGWPSLLF